MTLVAGTLQLDGALPLPLEARHHIFNYLKSDCSPSELAQLCLCSKSVYRDVIPYLYCDLIINEDNVEKVIYGLKLRPKFQHNPLLKSELADRLNKLMILKQISELMETFDIMTLTSEQRKLRSLGYVEGLNTQDVFSAYYISRILVTYQDLSNLISDIDFVEGEEEEDIPQEDVFNSLRNICLSPTCVFEFAKFRSDERCGSDWYTPKYHWHKESISNKFISDCFSRGLDCNKIILYSPFSPLNDLPEIKRYLRHPLSFPCSHDTATIYDYEEDEFEDGSEEESRLAIIDFLECSLEDITESYFWMEWSSEAIIVRDIIGSEALPPINPSAGANSPPVEFYQINYLTYEELNNIPELTQRLNYRLKNLYESRKSRLESVLIAYIDQEKFGISDAKRNNEEYESFTTIFHFNNFKPKGNSSEHIRISDILYNIDEEILSKLEKKVHFN
ncbi:uncharacterized protein L201_001496 [Kwoniella dendrophila CBS 6074]|uniref:F-box domain-containing protein n=1 Tax=Kwoniella dendrophila CBS 6074 TaxID=1295534 RepID=A0AAX4JPE7_9TREE